MMMLRPEVFAHAVLLRPMLPLQNPPPANLKGTDVLILRGRRDDLIPAESTARLEHWLRESGAAVTAISVEAGHELTAEDLQAAADWLSAVSNRQPVEAL